MIYSKRDRLFGTLGRKKNVVLLLNAKRQYVYMIKSELSNIKCFCTELQSCLQGKGPTPSYEIELCFGEEFPDPDVPKSRKLIVAQVGAKGANCSLHHLLLHIYSECICVDSGGRFIFLISCLLFFSNAKHRELGQSSM